MTLPPPPELEPLRYRDLVDEALGRIPFHNPEWTNHNRSDPGVTLIELFAFMAESIGYRANLIPERNRRKFLSLLGIPTRPAASARGIVTIDNKRGSPEVVTIGAGVEVRAGNIPFRTELGLDVLPVEGRAFVKRTIVPAPERLLEYHRHLYASLGGSQQDLDGLSLYETVPIDPGAAGGVAIQGTADRSVWIALMLPEGRQPGPQATEDVRRLIAGRTLSLGVVPSLAEEELRLTPVGRTASASGRGLAYELPLVPGDGRVPVDAEGPRPQYRELDARAVVDVLVEPGIVELPLPAADGLRIWSVDPLEAGVGDMPPSLEETDLEQRLVTWLRIRAGTGTAANLLWTGINATMVGQRAQVDGEVLAPATGLPDQVVRLANRPLVSGSVRLTVTAGSVTEPWQEIDDLLAAGPEVPLPDAASPPGAPSRPPSESRVFVADETAGELRFGDGARGSRPPEGVTLRASYAYGAGAAGNVGPGAIAQAPSLGSGFELRNPVRTWGGADADTVAEAEKQAARYLQHRDRLVSVEDFETLTWRTPGVELGRVDVLPAFSPELDPAVPGDAPGTITVLVLPRRDPAQPDAPVPDRLFLDAVCRHLDPRRLVTTEVFVRGPDYVDIWVSVGIEVVPGESVAEVRERVRTRLSRFLAAVDPTCAPWWLEGPRVDPSAPRTCGWPLGKPVVRLELMAEASRVPGVRLVRSVEIAAGADAPAEEIPLRGLDLPRVRLTVAEGDAPSLDQVRGIEPAPDAPPPSLVPVPVIPEHC